MKGRPGLYKVYKNLEDKNSFIRGLFDGDGTVHIAHKTRNIHIGFLGSKQSMAQLAFYLSYKLGIYQTQPKKCREKTDVELYYIRYAEKEDTEKIYNYLYLWMSWKNYYYIYDILLLFKSKYRS